MRDLIGSNAVVYRWALIRFLEFFPGVFSLFFTHILSVLLLERQLGVTRETTPTN